MTLRATAGHNTRRQLQTRLFYATLWIRQRTEDRREGWWRLEQSALAPTVQVPSRRWDQRGGGLTLVSSPAVGLSIPSRLRLKACLGIKDGHCASDTVAPPPPRDRRAKVRRAYLEFLSGRLWTGLTDIDPAVCVCVCVMALAGTRPPRDGRG